MTRSELIEVPGRWDVPTGWHWYLLSAVTTTGLPELGDTFARKEFISDEGTTPLVQATDVINTKKVLLRNKISLDAAQKSKRSPLKLFKERNLLVTVARDSMGRVGILDTTEKTAINNAVVIISPDERIVLLEFLYYYFLMSLTRSYLRSWVVPEQHYASIEDMGKVKVVVPPVSEQRSILQRIEALSQDIRRSRELLAGMQAERLTIPLFQLKSLLAHTASLNGRRRRASTITPENVVTTILPLLREDERRYIVSRRDALQVTVDAMWQEQEQERLRFDELEQSILEKAFQGRL